jgi:LysR family glycine cleavage system transcriptional activator
MAAFSNCRPRRVSMPGAPAAAEELGVMVGLLAFVRDDLASGRLVAPFDLRVPTEGGYFMAWRADRPVPQRVRDFESWIAAEAATSEA